MAFEQSTAWERCCFWVGLMGIQKHILRWAWLGLLSVTLTAPMAAGAQQLYRWVDENGQVHYGDRIPPQYAKRQRDELNTQGVVVDSKARELTPEELAAQERAKQEAEQAQLAAAEQARYDRYLVTTYSSVSEIIDLRDARLATLDSQLDLAQKNAAKSEQTLTKLLARRKQLETDLEDIPEKLQGQINSFEAGLIDSVRMVRSIQEDRAETEAKFQQDIERYLTLTSRR